MNDIVLFGLQSLSELYGCNYIDLGSLLMGLHCAASFSVDKREISLPTIEMVTQNDC